MFLENVFVFMQGHVVMSTLLEAVPGYCLLVDIGGGTTDLVEFVDGMPDGNIRFRIRQLCTVSEKSMRKPLPKQGQGYRHTLQKHL